MPTKRRSTAKLSAYMDPRTPGSLGGVDRYTHAQGLTCQEALKELRQQLAYRLHQPIRRRNSYFTYAGLPHGRTMGSRSSGDATIEEMELRHAVLAHHHRRFVQVHLGGSFEKADGESRHGRFPIHFHDDLFDCRRTRERIIQYDIGTMVGSTRYPAFFHAW